MTKKSEKFPLNSFYLWGHDSADIESLAEKGWLCRCGVKELAFRAWRKSHDKASDSDQLRAGEKPGSGHRDVPSLSCAPAQKGMREPQHLSQT